ncbi:Alt RNA polymerase ADP-ribosylase [Escherichia phage JS10]|uniref:NAD(+)--arginine ADP-ribosyltransferase n=1 Tax=Escherichia phage JS10 TaxID=576790 RepID=C4MZT8_9CAUD|nr:Alt-like RNA polymerase ADP-ribosyltransferase [Escherichia phage JS10]ACL78419.1 Alt RNA polymerase ADP-ribosylase [Escherichia phage JS10]
MENLNEVFDSDSAKNYPVTNLKPGSGIPQIFSIKAPGNDNLVARMVSYASQGDAIKMVKPGDKYVHVILMSLSSKGAPAELKGGLGSDPLGALNTIFDTIYEQVSKLKMDAVLFRFPTKKMKGKGPTVQRVLARLAMARTGGKFKVVDDMFQFSGKHTYVLLARRGTNIEDIKGMPEIDADLYTKVESKVGEVYVSKKTGQAVSKVEAVAASIAQVEEKRTDKAVISRTKISRRMAAAAQYSTAEPETLSPKELQVYNEFEVSVPVHSAEGPENEGIEQISQNFKKGAITKMRQASQFKSKSEDLANFRYTIALTHALMTDSKFKLNYANRDKQGFEIYSNNMAFFNTEVDRLLSGLSQINTTNSLDIIKRIVNNLSARFQGSPSEKASRIAFAMEAVYKLINDSIGDAYAYSGELIKPKGLTKDESNAIIEYCAAEYAPMNLFLLGKPESENNTTAIKLIKDLDSAFTKGIKLPKGTILYRGQDLPYKILRHNIDNKTFYFKNFVSASLKPNIFGEFGKNYMALDNQAVFVGDEGSLSSADELFKLASGSSSDVGEVDDEEVEWEEDEFGNPIAPEGPADRIAEIGMVIRGAEAVKVIAPGDLTEYSEEAEIILPRGLLLKVDKVAAFAMNDRVSHKYLMEATVTSPSELSESVYDGDHLMETGEVKLMNGFKEFLVSESVSESNEAMEILAASLDISSLPNKFKM